MRSVKYFMAAAGAASLFSSAALAADMPSIMPPPPQQYYAPQVEDFGGWYLRGDIGVTTTNAKLHTAIYDQLSAAGTPFQQLGHGFDGGTSYGVGVGYKFNNWFRADITGEYRAKVAFHGTDFVTYSPIDHQSDAYNGGYKSWVGLINAYADLGTWWCLTPFVGVGVGAAHIETTGFSDVTTFAAGDGRASSYFAEGASKTNFAWAAHAGVAYKVTNNFTVELAYRYLDMGTAGHGQYHFYDGTAGASTFQFRDMTSQDLKIGVRWTCCDLPPPPPPLVRKG